MDPRLDALQHRCLRGLGSGSRDRAAGYLTGKLGGEAGANSRVRGPLTKGPNLAAAPAPGLRSSIIAWRPRRATAISPWGDRSRAATDLVEKLGSLLRRDVEGRESSRRRLAAVIVGPPVGRASSSVPGRGIQLPVDETVVRVGFEAAVPTANSQPSPRFV